MIKVTSEGKIGAGPREVMGINPHATLKDTKNLLRDEQESGESQSLERIKHYRFLQNEMLLFYSKHHTRRNSNVLRTVFPM